MGEEEDSTEMALNIFNSPDPFEFSLLPYAPQRDNHGGTDLENRCLMMQNASPTSEACVEAGLMPTMQSNAELAASSQFVSPLPCERIKRVLDIETLRNRQIMSDNNMDSCQSSSRCGVRPCIFHHLNAIPMPSKGCKTNVICEDLSAGKILGSRSTMYSQEICKQETLEIEPWGDVVRELDDVPAETVGVMPTLQSNAESTEFLRRMGLLDFETPRNRQIMSDNNYMASCQASSRCGVLPSIFHHLNAIAMPSKDCKPSVIYEDLSAGKIPSSSSTMYSRDICRQETLEIEPWGDVVRELGDAPAETAGAMPTLQSNTEFAESLRRMRLLGFETPWNRQIMSDNNTASHQSSSRYGVSYIGLDLNAIPMSSKDCETNLIHEDSSWRNLPGPTSGSRPKNMRPNFAAGETESYKRCNCKKSKCMKLYCDCFAAGVYCLETCSCIDCFNKHVHKDVVMATREQIESRNPLAFASKFIRSSDSVPETGDDASKTPDSTRYERGCNCLKSKCWKKYCECYQAGVGCSINCRCEGCKNTFGRRDQRFFHSL